MRNELPATGSTASPAGETALVGWSNSDHPRPELRVRFAMPEGTVCGKQSRAFPSEKSPVIDLAWLRLFDPATPLEIIVQASTMQHEVGLDDYYRLWSRNAGDDIRDISNVDADPDRTTVLFSRTGDDGVAWVTRRTGFKVWQGQHAWVVTLNVACPEERLTACEPLVGSIADSFQPLTPVEHRHAEILRLVTRGAPVDFATYLPMGWRELPHRHDQPGPQRFAFTRKRDDRTCGVLMVVADAKSSHASCEDFLAEALSTWQKHGLTPRQLEFCAPRPAGNWQAVHATTTLMTELDGRKTESLHRCWLADAGQNWLYAEVFGPSSAADFESAALNRRALDLFARKMITA